MRWVWASDRRGILNVYVTQAWPFVYPKRNCRRSRMSSREVRRIVSPSTTAATTKAAPWRCRLFHQVVGTVLKLGNVMRVRYSWHLALTIAWIRRFWRLCFSKIWKFRQFWHDWQQETNANPKHFPFHFRQAYDRINSLIDWLPATLVVQQ